MDAVTAVSTDTLEADLSFLTDFADKNHERYATAYAISAHRHR